MRKFRNNINKTKIAADFDRFDELLNEIMDNKLIDVYIFSGLLDGLIKSGNANKVELIWNRIISEYNIEPNTLCYSFAIMAGYQCNKSILVDTLINELRNNTDLKLNKFCWNQILTAYGHLGQFDKMWQEYYNMIDDRYNHKPDIGSLSILTTFEKRKQYQYQALHEVIKYIENWNEIRHDRKKYFYRMACIADHYELQSILWPLLQSTGDIVQVYASFDYDGEHYILDNTYHKDAIEEQMYNELADKLIQKVGHKVDTSKHPEVRMLNDDYELSDKYAHKMLSYHAEKRALAFLIHKNVDKIEINVSMRMCYDCHQFFCSVSKYYPNKQIICIDPNKRHLFSNALCSCGKN